MELDLEEIKEAVVSRLVEKFEDEINLHETVQMAVREAVGAAVKGALSGDLVSCARSVIEETLSKPIQRTTRWGEAEGQPMPLRDHMMDEVRRVLLLRVDSYNGNLTDYKADKPESSLLGWMAKRVAEETVKTQFSAEIQQAVASAKAEIVSLVLARAKEIADKAAKGHL